MKRRGFKRTPEQENALRAAVALSNFLDTISDVIEDLRRKYPDQIRNGQAAIAAWQWRDLYRSDDQEINDKTVARYFERWKTRVRELGLAADQALFSDLEVGLPGVAYQKSPLFVFDSSAAERTRVEARKRLDELQRAFGLAVREITTAELAEEFGTTPFTVASWAREGLPFTRSETDKGRPMLFNLEEVKDWIRQSGSPHAKGMLADTITSEELTKAIATSSSMAEASEKLGISDFLFRDIRRKFGVFVPVPKAEQPQAWESIKPEELVEILERHEGRRGPIAEELGFSMWELRKAFERHDLLQHPFVLRPRADRPLPFTKEELEASITKHAGLRDAVAQELGVSRQIVRRAILDFDLFDHPMLQAGKTPASVSRSLKEKTAAGSGRGSPGVVTARTRGHQHGFAREATLVPFWLAAVREIMARHPGRGGGRATAADIGVSPVTLTNVIQGRRIPGYEVMEQIMNAAGRPIPDWRSALAELIDRHRTEAEKARGVTLPIHVIDTMSTILEVAPETVESLRRGQRPSMRTLQKILESVGVPYLVEAIATPETVAYGGRSEPPKVAVWRRSVAASILREYRTSGASWSASIDAIGADEGSVRTWAKQATEGYGPFVEAVQEDQSLLPLPPHLCVGAPTPAPGVKYGPWTDPP